MNVKKLNQEVEEVITKMKEQGRTTFPVDQVLEQLSKEAQEYLTKLAKGQNNENR